VPRIAIGVVNAQIGARIRNLRLTRKVSQTEIGRTIGVTCQQIQKYEKGTNRISASQLFRLAEAFAVPIDYFAPKAIKPLALKLNDSLLDKSAEAALEFAQTRDGFALMRAFAQLEENARKGLVAFALRLAKTRKSR
jgi:transcriptional regulator with XRE-family HTH domain